jgi:hypothetical protein
MIIDKSKGDWCGYKPTTYIDDFAYQLYLNYYYNKYGYKSNPGPQSSFMNQKDNSSTLPYVFYKKTKKSIRKEKLLKINNK